MASQIVEPRLPKTNAVVTTSHPVNARSWPQHHFWGHFLFFSTYAREANHHRQVKTIFLITICCRLQCPNVEHGS